MCPFLCYWVGLQNEKDKSLLLKGAERLQRRAASAHDVARTGHASTVRIQDANEDEDEDVTSTEGKLHVKLKEKL
jgi:hypothetical protein